MSNNLKSPILKFSTFTLRTLKSISPTTRNMNSINKCKHFVEVSEQTWKMPFVKNEIKIKCGRVVNSELYNNVVEYENWRKSHWVIVRSTRNIFAVCASFACEYLSYILLYKGVDQLTDDDDDVMIAISSWCVFAKGTHKPYRNYLGIDEPLTAYGRMVKLNKHTDSKKKWEEESKHFFLHQLATADEWKFM